MSALTMFSLTNRMRGFLSLGAVAICTIACSSNDAAPAAAVDGGDSQCITQYNCPVAVCDCVNYERSWTEKTLRPDKTCEPIASVCDAYCTKVGSTPFVAGRCKKGPEGNNVPSTGGRFPGERCNPMGIPGACVFPEVLPRCPDGRMLPRPVSEETIECPAATKTCLSEAELVVKYCPVKDGG
jgi:hypothetical protein